MLRLRRHLEAIPPEQREPAVVWLLGELQREYPGEQDPGSREQKDDESTKHPASVHDQPFSEVQIKAIERRVAAGRPDRTSLGMNEQEAQEFLAEDEQDDFDEV